MLLRAWADRGAVRILAEDGPAVLMEWLEGTSLAEIATKDDPKRAVLVLAEVAHRLHETPIHPVLDLPDVGDVLAPLLSVHRTDEYPTLVGRNLKMPVLWRDTC